MNLGKVIKRKGERETGRLGTEFITDSVDFYGDQQCSYVHVGIDKSVGSYATSNYCISVCRCMALLR